LLLLLTFIKPCEVIDKPLFIFIAPNVFKVLSIVPDKVDGPFKVKIKLVPFKITLFPIVIVVENIVVAEVI
jgi:hypothetical protein